MSLLSMWRSDPEGTLTKNIQTLVTLAFDSDKLKDDSKGAQELREFLSEVDASNLAKFADYCLTNVFSDSGLVLQDIVNEMGRRLGFSVVNGRYRGVRNDIGFDGLWQTGSDSLIIEVKTTDAYRISLDTLGGYADKLTATNKVPLGTPTLIVVGRKDTGELEAQVRGSKHAWSMRIISIDALFKLLEINEITEGDDVTSKIHSILRPIEYTRLDEIVDVVFTAAEDKTNFNDLVPNSIDDLSPKPSQEKTSQELVLELKKNAVSKLSKKTNVNIRQTRASMFESADGEVRAVSVVSKLYKKDNSYWYSYHETPQRRFLLNAKQGFLLLSMVDREESYALPVNFLETFWKDLGQTTRKDGRVYKHIVVDNVDGELWLRIRKVENRVSLSQFSIR